MYRTAIANTVALAHHLAPPPRCLNPRSVPAIHLAMAGTPMDAARTHSACRHPVLPARAGQSGPSRRRPISLFRTTWRNHLGRRGTALDDTRRNWPEEWFE